MLPFRRIASLDAIPALFLALLLLLLLLDITMALTPQTSRRTALVFLGTQPVFGSLSAWAADEDLPLLGKFTDPINHPGGTRFIELTGTGFGGFQLAKITGGGGQGEPAQYELPAMISPCPGNVRAKLCITIDFSPKGGPRDFTGYWDAEKLGIQFPVDGNFWPKVS